ncbi:MAG: hypothetical protein NZ990_04785 [Myxococcota bacterium]|nr:hypothetical protein [Myxococcota bacterium]
MILDHYSENRGSPTTFLVACPKTREAALINPNYALLEACEATLERRNLRLVHVLLTSPGREAEAAVAELKEGRGRLQVHPQSDDSMARISPPACSARPAESSSISLGNLRITALADPRDCESVRYRIGNYTFQDGSLRIQRTEQNGVAATPPSPWEEPRPARISPTFEKPRIAKDDAAIEQLLLEDLHTSLMENAFSPKETLIVRSYIELLEENDLSHPSAAELAEKIGRVDRGVIHVLVHSIRWKQIDLGRLPLVLAGQASKWLRHLKTEPEFTPHEKEFLCAYLQLVSTTGAPPSGPEVAAKLGAHRSIQWVRKRAFTIRRKQREFDQPLLLLTRNKPETDALPLPARLAARRQNFVPSHAPLS